MLEKLNHFLLLFPDKWFLAIIWAIVFFSWYITKHEFLAQLTRDLTMALLAILGIRRTQQNINTDSINADSMPIEQIDVTVEKQSPEEKKRNVPEGE